MIYGDGLLSISSEGITVDTALSEREAAQAKLTQHLTGLGTVIHVSEHGESSFTDWAWTGSHEDIAPGRKNESVYVDGPAFEGKPLLTLMDEAASGDEEAAAALARTINTLSTAVEDAFERGVPLADVGPLGTIVAPDGRILILPEGILKRALDSRSDADSSRFQGSWLNTALDGIDAWRFTLSCYAYCCISGRAPFPEGDPLNRAADYFDHNFVPLEWFCTLEGTDTDGLYGAIRANLSKEAPVQETDRRKKARKQKRETKSTPLPELPVTMKRILKDPKSTEKYEMQQKMLKKTRFFRQNASAIKWGCIAAVVLLVMGVQFIKDKLDGPSTKGLEPEEVITMFYDAADKLNTANFDAAQYKKSAASMSNFLSTMYVTAKMRESYEGMSYYTMRQWINLADLTGSYVFGITNLKLTPLTDMPEAGQAADTTRDYVWKAEYYYVFNQGNTEFIWSAQTDVITVGWRKGRWYVTRYETSEIADNSGSETMLQDAMSIQPSPYDMENQASAIISALKDTYPWLPTEEEAFEGLSELKKGWNQAEIDRIMVKQ